MPHGGTVTSRRYHSTCDTLRVPRSTIRLSFGPLSVGPSNVFSSSALTRETQRSESKKCADRKFAQRTQAAPTGNGGNDKAASKQRNERAGIQAWPCRLGYHASEAAVEPRPKAACAQHHPPPEVRRRRPNQLLVYAARLLRPPRRLACEAAHHIMPTQHMTSCGTACVRGRWWASHGRHRRRRRHSDLPAVDL